jgi:hypothetical protein
MGPRLGRPTVKAEGVSVDLAGEIKAQNWCMVFLFSYGLIPYKSYDSNLN